jgi:hypothetical protein
MPSHAQTALLQAAGLVGLRKQQQDNTPASQRCCVPEHLPGLCSQLYRVSCTGCTARLLQSPATAAQASCRAVLSSMVEFLFLHYFKGQLFVCKDVKQASSSQQRYWYCHGKKRSEAAFLRLNLCFDKQQVESITKFVKLTRSFAGMCCNTLVTHRPLLRAPGHDDLTLIPT